MTNIDTELLRDAIDIAAQGSDRALLSRLNATYKVLTPGREVVRLTTDLLTSLGFALAEREMRMRDGEQPVAVGAPYVLVPNDMRTRLPIDFDAAITVTPNPPKEGWADFSRFATAMHALVPCGKDLRARLGVYGSSWRVCVHNPRDSRVGHFLSRGGEGTHYVVPRPVQAETRCRVRMLIADGGTREGAITADLARAYDVIRGIPTFVLEEGARIEVSPLVAGGTDEVFHFEREKGWLSESGEDMPQLPWTWEREED